MTNEWRNLKVGDRVRFVRLPWFAVDSRYTCHPETRQLYRKLIARGRSARVYSVDVDGLPWIMCRFRRKDGRWVHHWLAINEDSWVRVRKRK